MDTNLKSDSSTIEITHQNKYNTEILNFEMLQYGKDVDLKDS